MENKLKQQTQKKNRETRMIVPQDAHAKVFAYAGIMAMVAGVIVVFAQTAHIVDPENSRALTLAPMFLFTISFFFLTLGITRLVRTSSQSGNIAQIMQHRGDRYARAAFGSREGMWDINPKTGDAFFSERWHTMLQLEPETISSVQAWQERIHTDDRESVVQAMTDHENGLQTTYEISYRIKTGNETYLWISDRGSRSEQAPGWIAGFSRDITREKNVEEALQSRTDELSRAKDAVEREIQNTKKFSQAVEAATDPIAIITVSGNVIYANQARQTLFGISREQMLGTHVLAQYREKTPKQEIVDFERSVRLGLPFVSENFIGTRLDNTTFEAALSVFPVREKGTITFFTSREENITKRKDVDRAKTEFVSLASHQLRTPLTAIRWYSEILLKERERPLSDFERKYIREIYDANIRMIELINTLLNVSRIDLGSFVISPKEINLADLLETVLQEMGPQIFLKHINITKKIGNDLPLVSVDPQLFRMVFQNLLSNAVKYTPPNGTVAIALTRESKNILFSFADSGIGISEKEQPRIFTKLFRADNARDTDPDGTGLGLYIVRAIMQASGGAIRFESEEGKGTTFYGTIPIDEAVYRESGKTLG